MTTARAPAVLLRLLLAACALLGGLDVHGLEPGLAAPAAGAPDGGGPQAHGEDCSHREGVVPPHAHPQAKVAWVKRNLAFERHRL
jgi:hypothetical protein